MNSSANIRAAFSRAASVYHETAAIQQRSAQLLLQRISNNAPKRICELGCGSGFLTRGLLRKFPESSILAIDIAPQMIHYAKAFCSNLGSPQFEVADARTFEYPGPFDLIISSSALHWMEPLDALLPKLRHALAPEGILCALVVTNATFRELHALRRRVAPQKAPQKSFRTAEELAEVFTASGLQIARKETIQLPLSMPSARSFLRHVSQAGLSCGPVSHSGSLLNRSELERITDGYQAMYGRADGTVSATYEVMLIETSSRRSRIG